MAFFLFVQQREHMYLISNLLQRAHKTVHLSLQQLSTYSTTARAELEECLLPNSSTHVIVKVWFRVCSQIYPYEIVIESPKIALEAKGRVCYF